MKLLVSLGDASFSLCLLKKISKSNIIKQFLYTVPGNTEINKTQSLCLGILMREIETNIVSYNKY